MSVDLPKADSPTTTGSRKEGKKTGQTELGSAGLEGQVGDATGCKVESLASGLAMNLVGHCSRGASVCSFLDSMTRVPIAVRLTVGKADIPTQSSLGDGRRGHDRGGCRSGRLNRSNFFLDWGLFVRLRLFCGTIKSKGQLQSTWWTLAWLRGLPPACAALSSFAFRTQERLQSMRCGRARLG